MRWAVAIAALVVARGLTACVDGVTPDCSVPSVCSPIEGDAGPLGVPDASTDASDASRPDAADAADGG